MLPRLWLLAGSDRQTDRQCHLLSCPGQLKRRNAQQATPKINLDPFKRELFRFQVIFDIVSSYLCLISSNLRAVKSGSHSVKKIYQMFKTKGGGVRGVLNNVHDLVKRYIPYCKFWWCLSHTVYWQWRGRWGPDWPRSAARQSQSCLRTCPPPQRPAWSPSLPPHPHSDTLAKAAQGLHLPPLRRSQQDWGGAGGPLSSQAAASLVGVECITCTALLLVALAAGNCTFG